MAFSVRFGNVSGLLMGLNLRGPTSMRCMVFYSIWKVNLLLILNLNDVRKAIAKSRGSDTIQSLRSSISMRAQLRVYILDNFRVSNSSDCCR